MCPGYSCNGSSSHPGDAETWPSPGDGATVGGRTVVVVVAAAVGSYMRQ